MTNDLDPKIMEEEITVEDLEKALQDAPLLAAELEKSAKALEKAMAKIEELEAKMTPDPEPEPEPEPATGMDEKKLAELIGSIIDAKLETPVRKGKVDPDTVTKKFDLDTLTVKAIEEMPEEERHELLNVALRQIFRKYFPHV